MNNGYQDCTSCGSTGRIVDVAGAEVVCLVCEGFGVLFHDTDQETALGALAFLLRLISLGDG
jgi:hypothetical protein